MASKQIVAQAGGGGKQPPAGPAAAKPGFIQSIRTFIEEVQIEMKKVSWPTRGELKSLTQLVLWALVVSGVVLGLYDIVFMNLMKLILLLG
ncbi:MAG: preprotein translocase subunit SecE [Candidatus Hydrogenedentes bacterium]|nr:preprotein translocase subunit SecE [Candidatus Hydrogenedentota bacterium]